MARTVFLLALFFISIKHTSAQHKITDTVWYNARWEICEEPVSRYYRVGKLMTDDTLWYFSGPVKDYTRSNRLLMEGQYSEDGWREGKFLFYGDNGKVVSAGNFEQGIMRGPWQWFYSNGVERALIYFPGVKNEFSFISYSDSLANNTLSNGVGTFEWFPAPFDEEQRWKVKGSFNKGRRNGKWEFRNIDPENRWDENFKEHYNAEGSYSKSTGYRVYRTVPYSFRFTPERLARMESLRYDRMFRSEGDTAVRRVVYRYLTERKTSEFIVNRADFDSSMGYIMGTLERYRFYFDFEERDIEGKIEFRIGPAGYPEDVTITAKNTDSSEVAFLHFLLNKFRNVQMPTHGGIDFEGYHSIYFYVLSIRKYLPVELRPFADKDLMFSVLPKEQFVRRLETEKKNIRRFLRKAYYKNF
jgi:hypothetical protein